MTLNIFLFIACMEEMCSSCYPFLHYVIMEAELTSWGVLSVQHNGAVGPRDLTALAIDAY